MTALAGTKVKCEPCLQFQPSYESVASAWKKVPSKDRDYHFFATLDFKDGQDVFRKLGLNSAPFVHFYPATKGPLLEAHPKTQMWTYDFNSHSFDAENFARQLSGHTPVAIPWVKPFNWALLSTVVLTGAMIVSAYILLGPAIIALVTSRWIWALGCLAFILTMVGGYMFVKIRMNPWAGAVRGRDGTPVISYVASGYQNQYGAETWITSALYTVLGASQICLIMYAPKVPSAGRQRTAVFIWLAVSWMLFSVLVAIFKMKHPVRSPRSCMQAITENLSTSPTPILSGAKGTTAIPPPSSFTSAAGYPPQPAPEQQRQRQPYQSIQDADQREDSQEYNPFGSGPPRYPPLHTSRWSAATEGATSFSMSAPLQSFNNIRKENGRGWRLFLSYGADWAITIGLTAAFFLLDGDTAHTDRYILNDGFRSFPSGHSSLSFAGLGFLSFYLAGKLHLFDKRGHTGKSWLAVGPLVGAALTAVSRTMDYRHHWQDVTTGSILGLTIAFFAYRQFFPPLSSPTSHKPFSPRIPRDMALPTHRRDISESQMPLTGGLHPGYMPGGSEPRERSVSPPRQYSIPVNASPYDTPQESLVKRTNPFDSVAKPPSPDDEDDETVATYATPVKTAT
ncbi:oligosaccharyl transferase subunit ost3/OST6 [Tulasnella sp. 427]|nr:oligosaccharyl transferase subunit ost3/OST6 [Tulasnella sp. 427]